MEPWRQVFRDGIVPQLSLAGLEALRGALVRDDWRLRQGQTLSVIGGFRVHQACAIAFAGWQGARLERAADVERFFWHVGSQANEALGDPGAFDRFVAWFDGSPRHLVLPLLLAEVNRAIAERTDRSTGEDAHQPEPAAARLDKVTQAVVIRAVPDRVPVLP